MAKNNNDSIVQKVHSSSKNTEMSLQKLQIKISIDFDGKQFSERKIIIKSAC